jgi:hypothetical protein
LRAGSNSSGEDRPAIGSLSSANIVVTGIGLYFRKDNARYCSLRKAVNLENVHAGGILNELPSSAQNRDTCRGLSDRP